MIIREATREDEPEVLALARLFLRSTSYQQFKPTGTLEELEVLQRLWDYLLEHGVVLVCQDPLSGNLDGFIALALVPNMLSGEIIAEEIAWFVHPDSRGGPIAGALWRASEKWARQAQAAAVKMNAPADEPAVARFYRRAGYRAIETSYYKRL